MLTSPLALRLAGWALGGAGRPSAALSRPRPWHRAALAVALAGALAVVSARIGWHVALSAYVTFAGASAALCVADLSVHRLPNRLTLPSYPLGVALLALAAAAQDDWSRWLRALAAALALFGAYLLLHLAAPRDLGRGDVKYAGLLGLHLGWLGWSTVAVGALGGFLVGGATSLALLAARRAGLRTRVAFGPAMAAGAFLAIALGPAINDGLLVWAA